ncbi:MAG: hypothetical protein AMS26_07280 [Bacteroides sp. SM23_62]|nr:MAG: hypothetical protein AMS26_07280 [Bacteroides sp. SM23_62]
MNIRRILLLAFSMFIFISFTDVVHYSKHFGTNRTFRVFTPLDYDPADTAVRYPVICYFHGCRGSYYKDGFTSYADGDTVPPSLPGRIHHPEYDVPYNADFERYSDLNKVIIVAVDGKIPGYDEDGCGVYYPYHHEPGWDKNDYNFSLYIRELFQVVDSLYNTIPGPQGKAITGLSYGGHSSMWVSAANPHLIRSCSQFGHSPHYYRAGPPPITTPVNVQELWRNYRNLPFRGSTNTMDYLRDFSEQTSAVFKGAGFPSEFHLADFCRHWAGDIPEQFDFHMKYFRSEKATPECFSYINFYPDFDVWGYRVETEKAEEGWTYLRDVTENGFGLYTRFRFPFGKSCGNYKIKVTSPPVYLPCSFYAISRYNYETGNVTSTPVQADSLGRLVIETGGGKGDEIGISGNGLSSPVLFIADTLHENLYVEAGSRISLSFEVINLSSSRLDSVVFSCTTENTEAICIETGPRAYDLEPGKVTVLHDLVTLTGNFTSRNRNLAYLRLGIHHKGKPSLRERIIQVHITDSIKKISAENFMIFDGRSEQLPVYRYDWGDWNNRVRLETISEGLGNGNGVAEPGETFSVWIRIPEGEDPVDLDTWHPVVPVGGQGSMDVHVENVNEYLWSTGRPLLSAQMRFPVNHAGNQSSTLNVQSELVRLLPANDCHRGSVDRIYIHYFRVPLRMDKIIIDN